MRAQLAQLRDQLAKLESLRGLLGDELADQKNAELEHSIRTLIDTGGGAAVTGRVDTGGGDFIGGDQINLIVARSARDMLKMLSPQISSEALQRATESHLHYLLDRHRYLNLKGMGVSNRVPLRLPLLDLYVPLKARLELPEGKTWKRDLRLAGRELPEEEQAALTGRLSEPQPVLDLLQQHDGLIILGEGYAHRNPLSDKAGLPDSIRQARTLEELAAVYRRPLAEFRRLNGEHVPPTAALGDGRYVELIYVPDPEFQPHVAARFAAEALVDDTLNPQQRVELIQSLVPLAMINPTALDTVLMRLLLAAFPVLDAAVLEDLGQITPIPDRSGDEGVVVTGVQLGSI